ncbi:TPA: retron St85 family RNA-directed DNA polymerase, partial [Listeria monocytogenes]
MNDKQWEDYKSKFIELAKLNNKTQKYIDQNINYAFNLFQKGLPIIYDTTHLGLLTGIKKEYIYLVVSSPRHYYRHFKIPKSNGFLREIDEPLPNLKIIQKWILNNILQNVPVSPYAKAYLHKTTLIDNAKFHKRQKIVYKLDIQNFFPSISSHMIYNFFCEAGYDLKLSRVLSRIVTLNNGLPQGAPTSPYLSNIIFKEIDLKIAKYCQQHKIRYTRYADDLTFSGDFNYNKLKTFVEWNIQKSGFNLNNSKTKILPKNKRQIVTGIVVNEKLQISKNERKKIRHELHYLKLDTNKHLSLRANNEKAQI